MRLNDDLPVRTLVHAAALDWMPSPAKGVERRMLFRIGGEKARATSIVRYAPGSRFSRHGHPGGEEFLVLEGTFQDETGDFPAGAYVRNPPGTGHAPGSESGCTIFVKLWQFRADDRERAILRPGEGAAAGLRPGVISSSILFENARERVMLEEWEAGAAIPLDWSYWFSKAVSPTGPTASIAGVGCACRPANRSTQGSGLRARESGSRPRRCSMPT